MSDPLGQQNTNVFHRSFFIHFYGIKFHLIYLSISIHIWFISNIVATLMLPGATRRGGHTVMLDRKSSGFDAPHKHLTKIFLQWCKSSVAHLVGSMEKRKHHQSQSSAPAKMQLNVSERIWITHLQLLHLQPRFDPVRTKLLGNWSSFQLQIYRECWCCGTSVCVWFWNLKCNSICVSSARTIQ